MTNSLRGFWPGLKPGAWLIVVATVVTTGCYDLGMPSLPNPPLSRDRGLVVLFAGWTPPGTSVVGTGMYEVAQQLRGLGVTAETYAPDEWDRVARELAAFADASRLAIAIVGYSLGGAAATQLADALRQRGIPVQTLLVVEAWSPAPVACNVRRAIDVFNSESFLSLSSRLAPGPGFAGVLERVNYSALTADRYVLNHWSISMFADVHRLLLDKVLEGDHVRRYAAPADACQPGATGNEAFARP